MARTLFVLGIWVLAASLGVLGYQALTLYFYRDWPPVSLGYGWQVFASIWHGLFGDFLGVPRETPGGARSWVAGLSLVLVGVSLSYLLFLLSDVLRGRANRS